MNDNWRPETEEALNAARAMLDRFVIMYGIAAIPSIVSALVGWSVENGAAGLMQNSLRAAADLVPRAEAAWKGQRR